MSRVTADIDAFAARFTEHRPYLLAVGYRLTSSQADAEDAVQDAWIRLAALDTETRARISDLRAWLVTVVSRVCLDRLRSARARRERYDGPWLPEPIVEPLRDRSGTDPAETVARDDEVRMAALIVLDTLTPEQRVAFVLHDSVGVPFAAIAGILRATPDAARQHASRGRRAVADAQPPTRAEMSRQRELLSRFVSALSRGDITEMVTLLHPDAVYLGDGGGKARTARQPMRGPEKIARLLLGLLQRYGDTLLSGVPVLVNGDFGLHVPASEGDANHPPLERHVVTFAVADDRVIACYDIANPDKLATVGGPRTPHQR